MFHNLVEYIKHFTNACIDNQNKTCDDYFVSTHELEESTHIYILDNIRGNGYYIDFMHVHQKYSSKANISMDIEHLLWYRISNKTRSD